MKLWIRKIFVVFIAIMTLGMYIPPNYLETDAAENKEVSSKEGSKPVTLSNTEDAAPTETIEASLPHEDFQSNDSFKQTITEQAKDQMVTKMGPRIIEKVEDDFQTDILPKMEEVIETLLAEAGEEKAPYYEITEQMTSGYGEKIFNMYDYRTKQEVARFDVRRDNRPGEGYWFNFHYHLSKDNFEKHHMIGEIYWDKNTPPKWMS
ncbi:YpjP family protein [Halobacillus seohaensis]|uniref:YpjP family protein n=1 Tax=Halobacillus seohaensis TaxID=447421 RepID=A0ABW2ENL1_9BACI